MRGYSQAKHPSIEEELAARYASEPEIRHESGLAVARALARLGAAEPADTPMAELRRPGSFLSRQVDRQHL